jgi:hypothetical protein
MDDGQIVNHGDYDYIKTTTEYLDIVNQIHQAEEETKKKEEAKKNKNKRRMSSTHQMNILVSDIDLKRAFGRQNSFDEDRTGNLLGLEAELDLKKIKSSMDDVSEQDK